MLRLVKDYALYVHLTYKDDDLFRSTNDSAWKPVNEQSSCSFSWANKQAITSSYYKNTVTTDLKTKL